MLVKIKTLAQRILAVPAIRKLFNWSNYLFLILISKSRILSAVFSSFATGAFLREQHAVVNGRLNYYRRAAFGTEINWPLIRRNTHRLEKGMVLIPRRSIFALDYIEETVVEFVRIPVEEERPDVKWCQDVLTEYFDCIEHNDFTLHLKGIFDKSAQQREPDPCLENFSPYLRTDTATISYDDFARLAEIRRSVRYFEDRRVDRDLLDRAFEVASQAPSACNRQPFRYVVFDDPQDAPEIASIPFGTLGYGESVPCVAVVVGSLDNYPSPRDRHVIYIDGALSAMSLMFSLETLGLSSCPINWPDFGPLESKMAKTLGLSAFERPIMLIAIGFPDRSIPIAYSKKKFLDQIREYRSSTKSKAY